MNSKTKVDYTGSKQSAIEQFRRRQRLAGEEFNSCRLKVEQ
jgi:hypothetical protein